VHGRYFLRSITSPHVEIKQKMERTSREGVGPGCRTRIHSCSPFSPGDKGLGGKMKQTPNSTDKQLAQELNQLTFQERERVSEDIHGVSKIMDEDPDFVDHCLLQMDMEFRRLKKHKKDMSAYESALFLAPRIVMDRDFRLMFLRAESFDPKKALNRMVKHFESKLELFGFDKLVKTITQEDLHEDAKDALRLGIIQPISAKDRSGRKIIFASPKYQGYQKRKANINHVRFIKSASAFIVTPTCYHSNFGLLSFPHEAWHGMVCNDDNFAGRRRGTAKWLRIHFILWYGFRFSLNLTGTLRSSQNE
jgi:hypothetical protein